MERDTVIIGSGVAAAAVARTLLEKNPGRDLLMLEAGPRVPARDRRSWWNFVVSGRAAYDHGHDLPLPELGSTAGENESVGAEQWIFHQSRLMAYGGSTGHWGGWTLRFKKEDFHLFQATGRGADWPFDYDHLEEDYCDAEHLLGTSADDPDPWTPRTRTPPNPPYEHVIADRPMMDALKNLEIPYRSMPVARLRKCMTTGTCKYCPFGARFAASYLLDELDDKSRYPHFDILSRSPVSELILDRKNRVTGVRYLDGATGEQRTAYGQRFAICSGALESPKLLLASRSRFWPRGVGNDTDLVGRHVISHPFLFVRAKAPSNPQMYQQELDFPTLMSRHYDSPKEQRDGKLFLFRDRSKPRSDLAGMMIEGKSRAEIAAAVRGPITWELQGFMEEFANPLNRIELAPGLNRLGLPQTRMRFARADGFPEASALRLLWMMEVIRTMGLTVSSFGVQPQRGDHVASTCRMAEQPTQGVVDPHLRVHGVDNLYLCSNAVFPSGAAVNPTLTLTALALRLGKHLP